MMRRFGLIGYPLGHSFSKGYFERKFRDEDISDCSYGNYEIEKLTEIPNDLCGFSVTIPHKQNIIPLLQSLDDAARKIGAVNCVDRNLCGYNTDAIGFELSLLSLIGNARPLALVLGTGGAAKAVVYVLEKLGVDYLQISRSGEYRYDNLTAQVLADRKLIINTTPLGMHPKVETLPQLPYEAIGSGHYLYDVVYNPAETAFMRQGRMRGAWVKNGIEMLRLQAEAAWEIWNRFL